MPARSRTILIIDDCFTIRNFLIRTLEKFFPDWAIQEAEDGKSAMHQLGLSRVDLIISDLQMPGIDGRTFLRRLAANSVLSRKPVLVLSADIDQELTAEYRLVPQIKFLNKPATREQIVDAIRGLLACKSTVGSQP